MRLTSDSVVVAIVAITIIVFGVVGIRVSQLSERCSALGGHFAGHTRGFICVKDGRILDY